MAETQVKTPSTVTKKTTALTILKPVDLSGVDLPTDRFQMLVDTAVKKSGEGCYTLWSHETPNLESLDTKLVSGGMIPHTEDSGETTAWEGLYSLKQGADTYYLVGCFQQGDYKFRKVYAIVGPTKEKTLALFESFSKGNHFSKRALASKYIFTPRNGRTVRPSYDWGKIVLPDEIRKSLQMNFSTFFKGPEAFVKAGVAYRRGILMVGAPGTGKTSVLKAVMSDYPNIPFFVFERTYDDVYVEDLRALYTEAAKMAPSVVVIEDIDRLVDSNFPLADLLNVLDGLGTASGVLTLATANHEKEIDPALVERPSRFDLVIRVPMPDKEHRKGYIEERAASLEIKLSAEEVEKLLRLTDKYTMAQMQEVYTSAVLTSFSEDVPVTYEHLLKGVASMASSLKVARKEEKKTPTGFSKLLEN